MNKTGFSQQNGQTNVSQRPSSKGQTNEMKYTANSGLNSFSFNSNPSSLKGKIQSLEEVAITHKKELSILNAEKDTLSQVLNMKAQDAKKTLMNELIRLKDEMNRHFGNQKSENNRILSQLDSIKADKLIQDEVILNLEIRIKDLECHIGNKESN